MSSYADFAYLYDMLTDDVDYTSMADYLESLFAQFSPRRPELIADIGCGTGTMCDILDRRGYDMIGIDSSEEMLNVARAKSGDGVLYLEQDMTAFELYGTVDVILCMLDSFNYMTEDGDAEKFFALAKNYLNPGGLLIFDINTPYKFKNIFADKIYTYENEKVYYTWENDFDGKICEFYLNFFVDDGCGKYDRITEQHFERCYEIDELIGKIDAVGLRTLAVFGDKSREKYKNDDERVFFIAKKD